MEQKVYFVICGVYKKGRFMTWNELPNNLLAQLTISLDKQGTS